MYYIELYGRSSCHHFGECSVQRLDPFSLVGRCCGAQFYQSSFIIKCNENGRYLYKINFKLKNQIKFQAANKKTHKNTIKQLSDVCDNMHVDHRTSNIPFILVTRASSLALNTSHFIIFSMLSFALTVSTLRRGKSVCVCVCAWTIFCLYASFLFIAFTAFTVRSFIHSSILFFSFLFFSCEQSCIYISTTTNRCNGGVCACGERADWMNPKQYNKSMAHICFTVPCSIYIFFLPFQAINFSFNVQPAKWVILA